MSNLATLLMVGFRKYHQSIPRQKMWGYTNFGVFIFIFLKAMIFEKKKLILKHSASPRNKQKQYQIA